MDIINIISAAGIPSRNFLTLCCAYIFFLSLAPSAPAYATTAQSQQAEETNDMLAAASILNGHAISHECAVCHTFDKGGPNKVGPNLFGIVGAMPAHRTGYIYSNALQKIKDRTWTVDALDQWLKQPAAYAPGTTMSFGGLLDPQDRMDLIAYLVTLR